MSDGNTQTISEGDAPAASTPATAPAAGGPTRAELISAVAADLDKATAPEAAVVEAAPAEAPAPAAEAAPEPAKASPFASEFKKLAEQKAQLRQEAAQIQAYKEATQILPVHLINGLVQAIKSGDTRKQLQILGINEADLKAPAAPAQAPKAKEPDEVPEWAVSMKTELETLRAERQQAQFEANRNAAMNLVKGEVSKLAQDFPLLTGLGEEALVLAELEAYQRQHGELPAPTAEESIRIAAKLAEERLSHEKARWSKVLTPAQAASTVPGRAPAVAQGSAGTGTLHNGMNSPAAASGKSREQRIAELAADPNLLLNP